MVKSSHVFFGWTNPTGDLRLPELGEQEQVSLHSLTALLCALYFCFLPDIALLSETLPDHHQTSLLVCLDIHSRTGPTEVNLSKCTRRTESP